MREKLETLEQLTLRAVAQVAFIRTMEEMSEHGLIDERALEDLSIAFQRHLDHTVEGYDGQD